MIRDAMEFKGEVKLTDEADGQYKDGLEREARGPRRTSRFTPMAGGAEGRRATDIRGTRTSPEMVPGEDPRQPAHADVR